jgi:hypothetical protein
VNRDGSKQTDDVFLDVVARAIEANPQTKAAIEKIVADQWWAPEDERRVWGVDLNREWRIGEAVTDALHLSIGHPGGGDPDDVRWEYTILLNLIYHIPDWELGRYCMEQYRPAFADKEAPR